MTKNSKLTAIIISFLAIAGLVIVGMGYALKPLLISFVIAYLVFPIFKKLENKGLNRILSISIIFVFLTAIVIVLVITFVPWMIRETGEFLKELPENSAKAIQMTESFAAKVGISIDLSKQGIDTMIRQQIDTLSQDMVAKITGTVSGMFSSVFMWLLALLNVLLVPLFFFFMINDYEKIKSEIKSYIPKKHMNLAYEYMGRINRILSGYIRGKLVVAVILGVLYGLGLFAIGLKFGFIIGFAAGVLSIIPYVGSLIGFVAATVMGLAYYEGWMLLVGICGVFAVAQVIESYVITPKFVGDSVGISAFVLILSIIIGGNLLGVMGILIAIPVAAILKEVLIDLRTHYHYILDGKPKKPVKKAKKK